LKAQLADLIKQIEALGGVEMTNGNTAPSGRG